MSYKELHVSNFRGIKSLAFEEIPKIALLTGKNGVGKTSILEALWIHHGSVNAGVLGAIQTHRGIDLSPNLEDLLDYLPEAEREASTVITSKSHGESGTKRQSIRLEQIDTSSLPLEPEDLNGGASPVISDSAEIIGRYQVRIDFQDADGTTFVTIGRMVQEQSSPSVTQINLASRSSPQRSPQPLGIFHAARSRRPHGESAQRLGQIEIDRQQDRIVKVLQCVEPELRGLRSISLAGSKSGIYAELNDGQLVHAGNMGDGFIGLLSNAVAIAAASDGIFLIDEVDNGIHYSALPQMWHGLMDLATEYNVQVVATTHSHEAAVAASEAFSGDLGSEFALFRVERDSEDAHRMTRYQGKDLDFAVTSGFELR